MSGLLAGINKFLDRASLVLITIMVLLVWAQVFMRYLLNFSPFWIEAAARYMMIWSLLMASAVLVGSDGHVRVDFVQQLYSPKMAKVMSLLLSLAILVFLLIYTVFGMEAALDQWSVREGSIRISMFWPFIIVPISGLLMILNLLVRMYEVYQGIKEA
jgi:TRAP-type C4-dicarboxylate transport system permease small subunit